MKNSLERKQKNSKWHKLSGFKSTLFIIFMLRNQNCYEACQFSYHIKFKDECSELRQKLGDKDNHSLLKKIFKFIYIHRILHSKQELKGHLSTKWFYKPDIPRISQKLVFISKERCAEAIWHYQPKKEKPNKTKQPTPWLLDTTSLTIC